MINTCTKFEFNPSTSWGSYARHRHNLLHGARSTTDIKPWHKHTTGELIKQKKHARLLKLCSIGQYKHDLMCFTIVRLLVKPLQVERIVKNENFNPIILY